MANAPTIKNNKAHYSYHIEDKYEVGISLRGTEIKSIRLGKISITESYIEVTDDYELIWVGADIAEYEQGNRFNHDRTRPRKLLAHKHEIIKMHKASVIKGYTIVPLKLFFNKGKAKLQIGVAKGKDLVDKRQTIKDRERMREAQKALKGFR